MILCVSFDLITLVLITLTCNYRRLIVDATQTQYLIVTINFLL